MCRALTDDDYHDDEAEWAKLKKATPPFVIVQFGPTRRHVASAPRVRLDGELLLVEGELRESLEAVAAAAQRVPPGQAKFFQAGLRTDDLQKRFLYLFISLEREVHRVFTSMTRCDHIAKGLSCPERVADPLAELIEKRLAWNNVADRFVWCVSSTWTDLGPGEVDLFRHLKRIRDGIAHGSGPDPTVDDVNALERLTRRILLWRTDQGIDDVFGDEAV